MICYNHTTTITVTININLDIKRGHDAQALPSEGHDLAAGRRRGKRRRL